MTNFKNPEGLHVYRYFKSIRNSTPSGVVLRFNSIFYKHLIPLASKEFTK